MYSCSLVWSKIRQVELSLTTWVWDIAKCRSRNNKAFPLVPPSSQIISFPPPTSFSRFVSSITASWEVNTTHWCCQFLFQFQITVQVWVNIGSVIISLFKCSRPCLLYWQGALLKCTLFCINTIRCNMYSTSNFLCALQWDYRRFLGKRGAALDNCRCLVAAESCWQDFRTIHLPTTMWVAMAD